MQERGPITQPLWRGQLAAYDKRVLGYKVHPTGYIFPEDLAWQGGADAAWTHPPAAHDGNEISKIPVGERSPQQIGSLRMVFQNPFDTLNPSRTIGTQIGRIIKKFGIETDKAKIRERVIELLDIVKLPRDFYIRRTRQLSGGQRGRLRMRHRRAGGGAVAPADSRRSRTPAIPGGTSSRW